MDETFEFFYRFFKNMNCIIEIEDKKIKISNVPQKFEKFCGKKSPYLLCFEKEVEGYELVNTNHYMINAIKDFLTGSGETALLKINFEKDIKQQIEDIIPFRNGKIKNVVKNFKNKIILRFSFLTEYYYLNEKENVVNSIYICDGKIFDFNENFKLVDGNKQDIPEKDFSKEYENAKIKIKDINKIKIEEISEKLNNSLQEEILRMKKHYEHKIKELQEQENSLNKQIELSKNDFEKIKKLKKNLSNLREQEDENKLKEEENLALENEIKKYSLRVNNKLLNTTIIYYPIYDLTITIEISKGEYKIIELKLDPYYKKINPVYCKNCNKELKEIIVCSSGHLTCRDCGDKCIVCGSVICKQCQTEKCAICNVEMCRKCSTRCEKCGKRVCMNHLRNYKGRKLCSDCAK